MTSLSFGLENDRMIVTAKAKGFPMAIPTELVFSTERNLFGIYIVKVLVGFARPLILKAVQWFAASRPEIEASDSRLYINPWAKIPVQVNCKLSRFAVDNGCVVVAFSPVEPPEVEAVEPEPAEGEAEPVAASLPPIPY